MLTVKEWEEIRRAYYTEGKSMRQIARETGRARRTIKRMIASEEPPKYQRRQPRQSHKLGPYKQRIQELLSENKNLPRKQRWTAHKIYEEIQKEGYQGAASTVRHYVGQARKLLKQPTVYLPLAFDPGSDAQVDWGEGVVVMKGNQTKVQLFLMKLCYSRRTFLMAFPSQKQEAFFEGHVRAFNFFGGVPHRISYDNLKAAVKEILEGRHRVEQEAFFHFRGHYLFNSHYCTPGAGHEKGSVEHHVGFYRRQFLVPLPEVEDFDQLNDYLLTKCLAQDERQVSGQKDTIGHMWQQEQGVLRPLPKHPFACCRTREVSLNPYSQVQLETNRYSVPADQARKRLVAKLFPFHIELYRPDKAAPIAQHPRCYDRHQEIIDPLHYLPLLRQRPGALAHAKPIRQWRKQWPTIYHDLLAHLQNKWSDGRGVREFVNILYLHRQHTSTELEQAIATALEYGCAHLDGVQLALRQQSHSHASFTPLNLAEKPRLVGVGEQPVAPHIYDKLVGGTHV